jgi:hypothetical protein
MRVVLAEHDCERAAAISSIYVYREKILGLQKSVELDKFDKEWGFELSCFVCF